MEEPSGDTPLVSFHPTFPPLLPDELLWSVVGRWRSMFFANTPLVFLQQHFGVTGIHAALPHHLRKIAATIPTDLEITGESIRDHHTMFSFVAPFAPEEDREKMASYQLGEDFVTGTFRLWQTALRIDARTPMRFCHACRKDDRQRWGISYWHRTHQLPGIDVCAEHLLPLTVSADMQGDHPAALDDAAWGEEPSPVDRESMPAKLAIQVASLRENTALPGRERLRQELQERIANRIGKMWEVKSVGEVTAAATAALGVQVDSAEMEAIFQKRSTVVGPQTYALLALWIGVPLQELLESARRRELDVGPWPCMDEHSECHGKRIITTSLTTKDGWHRRFTCPQCRSMYLRRLPLVTREDGSFDFNLTRASMGWAHDIAVQWANPEATWISLEEYYGRKRLAIAQAAIKMGLSDQPNRTLTSYRNEMSTSRPFSEVLLEKRQQWKAMMNNLGDGRLGDLPREGLALRQWLQKRDGEWYKENTPERKWEMPKSAPMDRSGRDAEVFATLVAMESEIHALRVSRRTPLSKMPIIEALAGKIGRSWSFITPLPSTMARVLELEETDSEFVERRIREARVHFSTERATPYSFKKWINVEPSLRREPGLATTVQAAQTEILGTPSGPSTNP